MRPLVSQSSVTYLWAWIQTYSYYELADSLAGIDRMLAVDLALQEKRTLLLA